MEEFVRQHNNHFLHTEHNFTPVQMSLHLSPMWIDWDTYGVDVEGPAPDKHPDNCVIIVPPQAHVTSTNYQTHILMMATMA